MYIYICIYLISGAERSKGQEASVCPTKVATPALLRGRNSFRMVATAARACNASCPAIATSGCNACRNVGTPAAGRNTTSRRTTAVKAVRPETRLSLRRRPPGAARRVTVCVCLRVCVSKRACVVWLKMSVPGRATRQTGRTVACGAAAMSRSSIDDSRPPARAAADRTCASRSVCCVCAGVLYGVRV